MVILRSHIFCDFNNLFYKSVKYAKTKKRIQYFPKGSCHKDKWYIKNWRPITLLDVDTKLLLKALSVKLKEVLPTLISFGETAYFKSGFIEESGRLISDIINISDHSKKLLRFIVTIDIKKAFNVLDHTFLIPVMKKFDFGQNFINCNET